MDDKDIKYNLKERLDLYNRFDLARQGEIRELAESYERIADELQTLRGDLEDVEETRRTWRRRAEDAEKAIKRHQFVCVLVDGDGYYFKEHFLSEASDSGGARAAYQLFTDVQTYLKSNSLIDPSVHDLQIMVNVYANRSGLAKALCDADVIQTPAQLDHFFCSFSQSNSLFQFIDCGPGKERVDAKLRDNYRFYLYNAHCKKIFLACCHDNGYATELDKYRHDNIAMSKTILLHALQPARQYAALGLPSTRFNEVFESTPLQNAKKEFSQAAFSSNPKVEMPAIATEPETSTPPPTNPQSWSSVMGGSAQPNSTRLELRRNSSSSKIEPAPRIPGIPINRAGQRLDKKLRNPTQHELNDFENRIRNKKLCNRHHLAGDCPTQHCKYDHGEIDETMRNTLKLRARNIPCTQGQYCRQADCFYGHHCPWGMEKCSNPKCLYLRNDMHNVVDTEIAKIVPAEVF